MKRHTADLLLPQKLGNNEKRVEAAFPADWQDTAVRLTRNIYKGTGFARRPRGSDILFL